MSGIVKKANIKSSIKKHKILIIIIGLIAFICLVCLGFHINKELDPAYRLFKPIINVTDSDVLDFKGCYESNGVYKCLFDVASDNAEGVGNELKKIYDKLNQLLQSDKYRKCIEISVDVPRVEHGTYNVIADFNNFKGYPMNDPEIYDHVSYVCGNEIDSEAEMYNSDYDYEINHNEYWEYFSAAEELILPQETNETLNSDTLDYISYCAVEKNDDYQLYFNFPQFDEDSVNAEKNNKIISGFISNDLNRYIRDNFKGEIKDHAVTWEWDNDKYDVMAMEINYTVTRNTPQSFCIKFEGLINFKGAAHPIHYINALTIDAEKSEIIYLSDLYKIEDDLLDLIRNEYNEQFYNKMNHELKECFPESKEKITENLEEVKKSGKSNELIYKYYLTDKEFVFIVPTIYAVGSYFETVIDYDKISSWEL